MKKRTRTLILLAIVVVLALGITGSCYAANVCKSIGGTAVFGETHTFTVETTKKFSFTKDYVKLTQNKGSMYCYILKTKARSLYGMYWVSAYDKTGKKVFSKRWKGSSSIKVKLPKKDARYTIEVRALTKSDYTVAYLYYGAIQDWKKIPKWTATKTKGITFCR